jgi:hypothetical protein
MGRRLRSANFADSPGFASHRHVRTVLLAFVPLLSALTLSPSSASASPTPIVLVVTDVRGQVPVIERITVYSEAEAEATMQQMQLQPGVRVARREYLHLLDVAVTDPLASTQW